MKTYNLFTSRLPHVQREVFRVVDPPRRVAGGGWLSHVVGPDWANSKDLMGAYDVDGAFCVVMLPKCGVM